MQFTSQHSCGVQNSNLEKELAHYRERVEEIENFVEATFDVEFKTKKGKPAPAATEPQSSAGGLRKRN